MKCVVISDTHGMHEQIIVPDGDVLIHAGDILGQGTLFELDEFNDWLGSLPHKHKIVVAGNHDWCFEDSERASRGLLSNAIYLRDESVIIDGVHFYGAPWQPHFMNWAFNLNRGDELRQKWQLIPNDTDVLITHGPAAGILDQVADGKHVGCEELAKTIINIKPKFHVFGHIHEGYGIVESEYTTSINACINTEKYKPVNKAIVFYVDKQ
jgi:Icc-related predicted phosphoesterase